LTGFTSSGCAGPGPVQSGGDERIRTADPLVANEVLSQLSYIPTISRVWPARLKLSASRATGPADDNRGRGPVKSPAAPPVAALDFGSKPSPCRSLLLRSGLRALRHRLLMEARDPLAVVVHVNGGDVGGIRGHVLALVAGRHVGGVGERRDV